MHRLLWIAGSALVAVLAWQTWTIASLRGEVAELRAKVDRLGPSPDSAASEGASARRSAEASATRHIGSKPTGAERSRVRRGPPAALPAPSSPGNAADPKASDQQALDEAIERTLKRIERTRFEKKGEQWIAEASDRIDRVVGKLVDEGRVPEGAREQVSDLLRNQVYFIWQLKDDVRTGTLNGGDARAQYDQSRGAVVSGLTDLVGEETASDLLGEIEGRGKKD